MVSVVVLAHDPARPAISPEAVVRTLASLVHGAIEGVFRDVVLAGLPDDPDLRRIADHAGCEIVEANGGTLLAQAVAAARDPLVMVLLAGEIPGEGFVDELSDALADGTKAGLVRRRPQGLLQSLLGSLAPVTGVLLSKRQVESARPQRFADLAGLARPARTFEARTRPIH